MKKNDLFAVVIVEPENFLRHTRPWRRGTRATSRRHVSQITCSTHVSVSYLTCEVCGTVGSERTGRVKRAGGFRCGRGGGGGEGFLWGLWVASLL